MSGLVAVGADLNAARQDGATSLFIAAQNGHGEIVSGLVAVGADLNAAEQNGATPLYIAAQNGHGEIVSGLVAAGADEIGFACYTYVAPPRGRTAREPGRGAGGRGSIRSRYTEAPASTCARRYSSKYSCRCPVVRACRAARISACPCRR
eukprot:COSAG03_NODE_626_length_6661_cov_3.200701_1_plen_150_part_00